MEASETLAEQYKRMVYKLAFEVSKARGSLVVVEDLVSVGMEALFDAARRYCSKRPSKRSRGSSFFTFAYSRVNGLMRAKAAKELRRLTYITLTQEETPDGEEELKVRYRQRFRGLDEPVGAGEDSLLLHETLPAQQMSVDDEAMIAEVFSRMDLLSPKQQQVLTMRYKDGMTLGEAGKKMGLTRERIRQIEAKALRLLRDSFATSPSLFR